MPAARHVLITLATLGSLALAGCDARAQRAEAATRPGARPDTTPLPECEWCGTSEAPAALTSEMRIAGPAEPGTRFVVSGVVYQPDGRTPARDVVLYAYHTNAAGRYPHRGDETGNGRRHGYLRGWLRTDAEGRYRIATIRPMPYPTRREAAHIHLNAQAPGGEERYLKVFLFADDELLSPAERAELARGDAHVVRPVRDAAGVLHATRDIVLERWP